MLLILLVNRKHEKNNTDESEVGKSNGCQQDYSYRDCCNSRFHNADSISDGIGMAPMLSIRRGVQGKRRIPSMFDLTSQPSLVIIVTYEIKLPIS